MSTMSTQAVALPQQRLYPGLSGAMSQALDQVMQGITPNPNLFNTRRHVFYHRLDYATGGQQQLPCFNNVAPSRFICNMPLQAQLPTETAFRLNAVRIWAETGITAAATYTRAAAGASISADTSTSPLQFTNAEEIRTIFQGGMFTLKLGDQVVVDQQYGLNSFPAGGGSSIFPGVCTTDTTVSASSAVVNNGTPEIANTRTMAPPIPILPNKVIAGLVEWQAALSVTTAFILRIELDGVLVSPRNN